MNSLKIKLLGLISLVVILVVSLAAYVTHHLQRQMISHIAEHDTQILSDTLKIISPPTCWLVTPPPPLASWPT